MTVLELMDRVRAGQYHSDRFVLTSELPDGTERAYTLQAAMQHAQVIMTRADTSSDWQGVITPACHDRTRTEVVSHRVGVGLRLGGEASLCFACGPDGGHYHPSEGETMDSVMATAARLAYIKETE